MKEILAFINLIISKYPQHEKLLLVSSITRGYQLLESLSLELLSGFNLRAITAFDLALEILEPDIRERKLKVISDKQTSDILEEIISSLFESPAPRGWSDGVLNYEKVVGMRMMGITASECETGLNNSKQYKDLGRILNEYDLALEAGGFLDEAAVFDKATAIIQSDPLNYQQIILIIPERLKLSSMAQSFIDTMRVETAY